MPTAHQIAARLLEFDDPDAPDFDPKEVAADLATRPGTWNGPPTTGYYAQMLQRYEDHRRGQATGQSRMRKSRTMPLKATFLVKLDDGSIAVRYYDTDVITVTPEGLVTVDTGGYHTVTTAHRMENYMPHGYRVYRRLRRGDRGISDEHLYWACEGIMAGYEQRLSDGDTISPDGTLSCQEPPIKARFRDRDEA